MISDEFACAPQICSLAELPSMISNAKVVISFLDPEATMPPLRCSEAERIEFRFHDIIQPLPRFIAPTEDDIKRLISFGRRIADNSLLEVTIHCHQGISRSTAASLILLGQRGLFVSRQGQANMPKLCWPNSLMLHYADRLLGCDGRLEDSGDLLRRATLEQFPDYVTKLSSTHRRSEVQAAGQRVR